MRIVYSWLLSLLAPLVILMALFAASCGGGSSMQIPNVPQDVSGNYTFNLQAIQGQPAITLKATLTQGVWANNTATVTVTGTIYGVCYNFGAGNPPVSAQATLTADPTTGTKSLRMIIWDQFGNGVLEMDSKDFAQLSGTWFPLTDIDSCNGVPPGQQSTWTATKQ